MSRTRTADADYVSLSAEDMARFHRNAPAALARRGGGFVMESLASSFELVAMGAAPIVGMLWFDWSAAQLLVFLLAGAWVGILCDVARLVFAGRGVQAFGKTHYDDWQVWVIVEALRAGRNTAPRSHLQAKYVPWAGVLVDFVAGGMATVLMTLMLANRGVKNYEGGLFDQRSLVISLACLAGYQVAAALWEIALHRRGGSAVGPVEAQPGKRGVGLFVLLFVMLILGNPASGRELAAERVMLMVNGGIVVFGVLKAAGLLMLRGDTLWLRDYLQPRRREVEAPQVKRGKKRGAKRR